MTELRWTAQVKFTNGDIVSAEFTKDGRFACDDPIISFYVKQALDNSEKVTPLGNPFQTMTASRSNPPSVAAAFLNAFQESLDKRKFVNVTFKGTGIYLPDTTFVTGGTDSAHNLTVSNKPDSSILFDDSDPNDD
jgi:hypothetical protein